MIARATAHRCDTTMFIGVLGIILGWFLIISMISANTGVAFSAAGILAVALGYLVKHANRLWHKVFG